MPMLRRWRFSILLAAGTIFGLYYFTQLGDNLSSSSYTLPDVVDGESGGSESQSDITTPKVDPTAPRYPVKSLIPIPTVPSTKLPKIQADFPAEDKASSKKREKRLKAVRDSFQHAWTGYKKHAWLQDEVAPLSGNFKTTFGGWAATLVDTLDTLWIVGLHDDFEDAVKAASKIDFTTTTQDTINVFETTIRYLGGFLGAYDISGGRYDVLLEKAVEVGDMLLGAFDTPNRMPITRWNMKLGASSEAQVAPSQVLVAELGSLTLEFTRLAQLTKEPKYFDAIQRITNILEQAQETTKLPGMWPIVVDAAEPSFADDNTFTLGGMADSLYEYLPKQHALLGGSTQQYRKLYERAFNVAKDNLFFRPMNEKGQDILLSGDVKVSSSGSPKLIPRAQHLTCFAGGMVGIGAKLFQRKEDLQTAKKLVDGCLWGYESSVTGIMPEILVALPCKDLKTCPWDEAAWHQALVDRGFRSGSQAETEAEKIANEIEKQRLIPGVTDFSDRRYILRPEAIESVFVLYRITGEEYLLDKAWAMFSAIEKYARTDIAHAALNDVTDPKPDQLDQMESFWLAETLKYFYLIFSKPNVVSLDDYVLNTEAHPLKRPN
ncbi:MAG: hypothetical protein M4579_004513 [Chaenotheca gracillima]|nr:MAG: hypothetical protein M4579_004513 [Chaenotheca gracillima]